MSDISRTRQPFVRSVYGALRYIVPHSSKPAAEGAFIVAETVVPRTLEIVWSSLTGDVVDAVLAEDIDVLDVRNCRTCYAALRLLLKHRSVRLNTIHLHSGPRDGQRTVTRKYQALGRLTPFVLA